MDDVARTTEERSIEASERIVLDCRRCGERLILLGREEDWHQEERTSFECKCGQRLTLSNHRADEKALAVKDLLRSSIQAPRRIPNNPAG